MTSHVPWVWEGPYRIRTRISENPQRPKFVEYPFYALG